jgi:hypothetical protein
MILLTEGEYQQGVGCLGLDEEGMVQIVVE